MAQFDVHANPVPGARRAYPWVVVMQSDLLAGSRSRLVAPMAPRVALPQAPGRLTPAVHLEDSEYLVLVPSLASLPERDLGSPVGSVALQRQLLLAAVDYLFFGV
jgi:toxin CcdB